MQPAITTTCSPRPTVAFEPAAEPEVTCILVTYGTGPIVVDCIGALAATLADDDVAFEIVVVDNEHRWAGERTRRLLRLATRGVRLIVPHRNLGFAGGNNIGAEHARGRELALVNPDVIVQRGWYPPLRAALATATIATPVFLNADGSVQEVGHGIADDGATWPIVDDLSIDATARPAYASAACWVMRASEFHRLGRFDTSFHPAYYEDADFGLRAARDGDGTIVVGSSRVVHARGGSTTRVAAPDLSVQRELFRRRWRDHLATCPPFPG